MTAEEFLALPDDGWRHELIEGVLRRMPPAGGEHGEIEIELIFRLRSHLERSPAGKVYPGDTGFWFDREGRTILIPDVAFVRAERLPPPAERRSVMDVIPDVVVEIVSPNDPPAEVSAKVDYYLERGVRLVWVAHPTQRVVAVHRPGQEPRWLTEDDALDGEDVLPECRVPVADVFR